MLLDNRNDEHKKEADWVVAMGLWISSYAPRTVILIKEVVTFPVALITYSEQQNNTNKRKQVKGERV